MRSSRTVERRIIRLGFLAALLVGCFISAAHAQSIILPEQRFAWSETVGWVNFQPNGGGVDVRPTHLSGFAWGENIGWIKFGADGSGPYANTQANDWGVNRDPVTGALSGFAWSETVGWISFGTTDGQARINQVTGAFSGFAWSENIGWIHLANLDAGYGVRALPFIAIPALSFVGLVVLILALGALVVRRHTAASTRDLER